LILLSTSRVYSAENLAQLPVVDDGEKFLIKEKCNYGGVSTLGINEAFPTSPPVSLYGASKFASETLILEYGNCFDFPVWINRCGVLAGAGQFGKADQGIFSFWIHSFFEKKPLKFIGFKGAGFQVRDVMHPRDLAPLLLRQMQEADLDAPKIINLGGGVENSMSLKQLTSWCQERFGKNDVIASNEVRPMDAPWIVMDSVKARSLWNWRIETKIEDILDEIADHAEENPNWLSLC
jgi:CDP-paratose 2-epimerase